jgi:D-aminoacyl-tRNA deacylase
MAVGDERSNLRSMAEKIVNLRIFPDDRERFHFSLLDIAGAVLVVPQFTLFADTSKGRRPEFFGTMKPPQAEEFFHAFAQDFVGLGISPVAKGVFGTKMKVEPLNDGPVSIFVENYEQRDSLYFAVVVESLDQVLSLDNVYSGKSQSVSGNYVSNSGQIA